MQLTMHPLIDLQRRVPEYAPFNTTIVDDYRAYSEVKTLATRARIWDIDTPKSQNEVLDDVMLRKKLDSGVGPTSPRNDMMILTRLTVL